MMATSHGKGAGSLRRNGYPHLLMPDTCPGTRISRGLQAFAFSYGYIRGLLQASGRLC